MQRPNGLLDRALGQALREAHDGLVHQSAGLTGLEDALGGTRVQRLLNDLDSLLEGLDRLGGEAEAAS